MRIRPPLARLLVLLLALPAAARAGDVVSLGLCTDQYLVLLAPERVAALEPLARDPSLSFVAAAARRLPTVRADAEAVLALHPRLVLAEAGAASATLDLLRAHGVPVATMQDATDFPAIEAQTRRIAVLLGVPARGETLIGAMRARLAAAARPSGRSAIFWQPRQWSAGPRSLDHAVLQAAGLRDAGTGRVIDRESLFAAPPDVLVTQTQPRTPSLATDAVLRDLPASVRHVQVAPQLLICGAPFTARAVQAIAQ